jgi:hypothetical protein
VCSHGAGPRRTSRWTATRGSRPSLCCEAARPSREM